MDIIGIKRYKPRLSDHTSYNIHGKFSVGPEKKLNWYYNGVLLQLYEPHYTMVTDGLHAVLQIKESTNAFWGQYELKIEGTSISDHIYFHFCKFKKVAIINNL